MMFWRLLMVTGWLISAGGLAEANLDYIEDLNGKQTEKQSELVQWTHSRLVFNKDIKRVAVGQNSIIEVDVLGGRELLMLAKNVGRTTLMVWYEDGTSQTLLFGVSQDMSVLKDALYDIHDQIRLEVAPDRPALVLRGKVPNIQFKLAADAAARNYLNAERPKSSGQAMNSPQSPLDFLASAQQTVTDAFRLNGNSGFSQTSVAVINLIQVETLPQSLEKKVAAAVAPMGGRDVRIRRVIRGDIPDDAADTFILEGEVQDQVTLTRILQLASRLLGNGDADESSSVVPITNESGGFLAGKNPSRNSNAGAGGNLSSGGSAINQNGIQSNVARSKLLSLSGGRVLSVIEVRDLPQIRVSVEIHEINRTRMRQWRPDLSLITQGYTDQGLFSLGGISAMPPSASTVENALQVLGGTLTNNLQIGGDDLAFDLLFSLMEREGISRTLSRPTLMVLAGESAAFTVGGEVPVPTAFAPTGLKSGDEIGTNAPGVFSGTSFKAFGINLSVRAMVDEADNITLDLNPTISMPDTTLTQEIANSTGASLNSAAFNTRSINTSARLKDGQPLVLGGLVYQTQSGQNDFTPGVRDIPLIGKLVEAISEDEQSREIVIVVTPNIVRTPDERVHLWAFPSTTDMASNLLLLAHRKEKKAP
ncbi:pilus assembly protein N-terminal domain-containing protein [Marinobacter sp. M3C]|uniref:pilus assembly protein N-terminal domain-containing protein n=1 Tax=unclassified Marinobacter TaxID=83889 RepID=UPI00200BBB87|nr:MULTISPECIES: pilus assembly protein N-terminal domain-containing protein [unclassified Marinobacter]MCL1478297.1 pilus assembly protein N-terminal domain-containing protein [Marinobacter sp.]MCL1480252.1 pilus assembly protein N-terminal domain-containing protein [Marinobacter sp.]MCL1483876.1 pilus assembly protein N-terminal domain-containing protein [Marinobacter sp.]MCL1487272.1 pilus assembly protein N-terminal domain-containing protein [Marinobacter sp.]UQG55539.1 pilus assembly prot